MRHYTSTILNGGLIDNNEPDINANDAQRTVPLTSKILLC